MASAITNTNCLFKVFCSSERLTVVWPKVSLANWALMVRTVHVVHHEWDPKAEQSTNQAQQCGQGDGLPSQRLLGAGHHGLQTLMARDLDRFGSKRNSVHILRHNNCGRRWRHRKLVCAWLGVRGLIVMDTHLIFPLIDSVRDSLGTFNDLIISWQTWRLGILRHSCFSTLTLHTVF